MSPASVIQYTTQGYAILEPILSAAQCDRIAAQVAVVQTGGAGTRSLLAQPWCQELAADLRAHVALADLIPARFVATQCTYFEKSKANNWLVAMHQDIAIPVASRIAHAALGGWSEKEGTLFVNAPESVLQELVAVRLHLDDSDVTDGALRVIPGTHRRGRIATIDLPSVRTHEAEVICAVAVGGAMVLSPLLLHASSKATGTSRRRVLHFLFGPPVLPFGLQWHIAK